MQPTHVVKFERNEPSLEITRKRDDKRVTFRNGRRLKEDEAKLWAELFGELRPRVRKQDKSLNVPVFAIRLAVELVSALLHNESSWTPYSQLRIDFVQLCVCYADRGFPWDELREGGHPRDSKEWLRDARVHFRGRLSSIYRASEKPVIYLSSNDGKVVWEIPEKVSIFCENKAEEPRIATSRYFFMPRDEVAYRDFLLTVLDDEVTGCKEDERVELYVLGRHGRATFRHLDDVSTKVGADQRLRPLFQQYFSSWFFLLAEGKKKEAEHILDTMLEKRAINHEPLEYADKYHPVVQGILMVRWSKDLEVESSHLFVDYWHLTDKFCYRYYKDAHAGQTTLEHAAGTVEIPGVYSYMVFYGELLRHFRAVRAANPDSPAQCPGILLNDTLPRVERP